MSLNGSFMIRTANSEIYHELVEKKKYFKRQIELFISALSIGLVNDIKSNKTQNRDIIRLNVLETRMKDYKDLIELVSRIICIKIDQKECGNLILKYADGGLEKIWDEYQIQGLLDLPRFYEETKDKWQKLILKIENNINTN